MHKKSGILLKRYVYTPFKLLLSNASIFILFFLLILIGHYTTLDTGTVSFSGKWTFDVLPGLLRNILTNPYLFGVLALGFIAQTVLSVAISQDMKHVFRGSRKSLIQSLTQIKLNELVWYFLASLFFHIIFLIIAAIFYIPSYFAWYTSGIDLTWMLIGIFALLFPIFYSCLSISFLVSVLPITSKEKWGKFGYFLQPRNALKTYLFYIVRLGIEYIFLFIIPFIALAVWSNETIAGLSAMVGLIIPFAFLRGSSYEFKLQILKEDTNIRAFFREHYERT